MNLAKAAPHGMGWGSSLHNAQWMGSGHVQPSHQDWSVSAKLFHCSHGLQGYLTACLRPGFTSLAIDSAQGS